MAEPLKCEAIIAGMRCGEDAKECTLANDYVTFPGKIALCDYCRDLAEHGWGLKVNVCTNPAQLQLVQ